MDRTVASILKISVSFFPKPKMLASLLKPLAVPARADARVFLKDYRPFPFHVRRVSLAFEIFSKAEVHVSASLDFEAAHPQLAAPWLELNGSEALELLSLKLDDRSLTGFERTADLLRIRNPPTQRRFNLKTVVKINPEANLV